MVAHDAGYGKRIYISCYDDAQIYVVDPIAWRVESIIDVGSSPTSLVFLPSHPTIAMIANFAGNHLSVIDLDQTSRTRNRVVHRIGLPHGYGE
jgi:DNA-binding beta-propeller fold protein YncE